MSTTSPSFGTLLRTLHKRVGMTQGDLAAAVGYSAAAISALEQERRLPAVEFVVQTLVPALALADAPQLATRLVELAAAARGERPPTAVTIQRAAQVVIHEEVVESPGRLPSLPTALIGRTTQLQHLCDRLLGHGGRLLTLVGPPGIGKTTLALAVAAQVQYHYPHDATFVPLAAISEPTLMISAILGAVGNSDASPKPPKTRLIEFLRRKTMLLVLDNLEQIREAAPLIAELLTECPGVCILATSRERLHLRAEQRYPVPPLSVAAACELFTQRAQAVDPAFVLTPENQPIIAAICQRLDCLPLALELSAVQVDLFSLPVLLARLQDRRLDLLTNGLRDLPAHQQTLRQAIHRSYILLDRQEQALFRALGAFVGGFDLAGVRALGFAEATLQALVNKSLVSIENYEAPERRFLYLETIRDYAQEQLVAINELARVREQHAYYFLKLSEEAVSHFGGRTEKPWLARLTWEHANLYAAMEWLVQSQPVVGQQMAGQLSGFWSGVGRFAEGRAWLAKALAASAEPTPSRALALQAAAALAQDQNDNQIALALAQESLALFAAQNNPTGCASTLYVSGWALAEMEQPEQALRHFERSLPLARQAGQLGLVAFACVNIANMLIRLGGPQPRISALLQEGKTLYRQRDRPPGLAYALRVEARLSLLVGDYAQAAALLTEAMELVRPLSTRWQIANTLEELANVVWRMGQEDAACTYLTEALQFFQENEIELGIINVWYDFGQIERCVRRNLEQATTYYGKSLALSWKKQYKRLFGRALVGLAWVAQARGDLARTARLAGMAQQLFAGLLPFLAPRDRDEYDSLIDNARAQLGEMAFTTAWTEGQALPLEEALHYASPLPVPGYVASL
ncbi:MAG: NACHT domain-containing protein [Caldilinea sp. CFX5]|nr:NACHT domain-containing protein [Caldilinea sp. CFX5]